MICRISGKRLAFAFLTALLSAIISISVYHLWGTDLRVPISGYRSDSLGVLLELKNYVRGGSVHHFVIYGEPYADSYIASFGDSSCPMPLLKLIWKLTGSVEEAVNIHAVLNSILLSLALFWVCTRLGVRNVFSMVVGVAYGNLSYFVLGANTVLLIYGACFYIPLFCYILIELMRSDSVLHKLAPKDAFFILAVMLYMGMNSAYYAFLAMILLAFTTLYVLFVKKDIDSIMFSFLSFIAIGMGIVSYTMPAILKSAGAVGIVLKMGYTLQVLIVLASVVVLGALAALLKRIRGFLTLKKIYGILFGFLCIGGIAYMILWKYTDYVGAYEGRSLVDVQLGSLKAGSMVLPAVNSVFGLGRSILGAITDIDNLHASDIAEIGVLAGVGFIYSVIMVFQYGKKSPKEEVLKICGLMNSFILVVAIKGGLSLVIGAFITTGIRVYSRMCVFLAVFGLISTAILMDRVVDSIKKVSRASVRYSLCAVAAGVLGGVLMMSVPTDFIYKGMYGFVGYEQRKSEYDEWQRYVGAIEQHVPEGSMILELPTRVDDTHRGELMTVGRAYELSIPAVVSETTFWNEGGKIKKTINNIFENNSNMEELLTLACVSGYDGIYIDTMMYHDDSYMQLINALGQMLGEPLICNENRRYFYDLSDYDRMLHKQYSDSELEMIKEQIAGKY